MRDDPFPVKWAGRQAVVAFPAHIGVSNVGQLRDRLLAVINRGAAVLIADMTGTASCELDDVIHEIRDHAFTYGDTGGADPAPLVTGWSAS